MAVVAESDGHLREVLDTVERFVAARPDVELLDVETAWLEPDAPRVERPERRASRRCRCSCDRH